MGVDLTPDDIDRLVQGPTRKPGAGELKPGDMRIGKKLIEFRTQFGFPRSTVAEVAGVSVTSITRMELGQRMFSAHSLSGVLVGLRKLIRLVNPKQMRAYEKWAFELLEIVHTVEEEQRIQRRIEGKKSYTTEDGPR